MTLNSALARSIKGVSPLSFIAIHCHFVLLKLLNPNTERTNKGVRPVRLCSVGCVLLLLIEQVSLA